MKQILSFALCATLLFATACNSAEDSSLQDKTPGENTQQNSITPVQYSDEQEDIIETLSCARMELYTLEYQTDVPYEKMEVWLEVYENGQIVETVQGLHISFSERELWQGQLVILVQNHPNLQFTFINKEKKSGLSITLTEESFINISREEMIATQRELAQTTQIEENKEIILYAMIFYEDEIVGNSFMTLTQEQIEKHGNCYVVKCKFSN